MNYQRKPADLKRMGKRIAMLNQNVCEMRHYWKIRCKERKSLANKNKRLTLLLLRMLALEKALSLMMNRKKHFTIVSRHRNKANESLYPLYLSIAQHNRLNQIFINSVYALKRPVDKHMFYFTNSEYQKLKSFLKKDNRFKRGKR